MGIYGTFNFKGKNHDNACLETSPFNYCAQGSCLDVNSDCVPLNS